MHNTVRDTLRQLIFSQLQDEYYFSQSEHSFYCLIAVLHQHRVQVKKKRPGEILKYEGAHFNVSMDFEAFKMKCRQGFSRFWNLEMAEILLWSGKIETWPFI